MPELGSRSGPVVTVCVPTVGRRDTLVGTLRSLQAQTYSNYKVHILDNASPEDAQSEIAAYAESDSRVSVLRTDARLPMFANFQRGVDSASGTYVTFFHDDDLYAADFLAEHVRLMERYPTAAFAGSNCELIDIAGNVDGGRDLIRETERWAGWRYIHRVFALGNNVFPMQSIFFRRSCLGPDTFAAAQGVHYSDFVILMRLAESHDVGLIARRLLKLRVHAEQASRQIGIQEALRLRTMVFQEYCAELDRRWPARHADVERLRQHVARARRTAALWSWINAKDRAAAVESRAAIGDGRLERWLAGGLAVLDVIGVSRLLRARVLRRTLRGTAQYAIRASSAGSGR